MINTLIKEYKSELKPQRGDNFARWQWVKLPKVVEDLELIQSELNKWIEENKSETEKYIKKLDSSELKRGEDYKLGLQHGAGMEIKILEDLLEWINGKD